MAEKRKKEYKYIVHQGQRVKVERYEGDDAWVICKEDK